MASLVYVTTNYNSLFVRRLALQFVSLLPPGPAVLTAIIRQLGEPTPELKQQTSLKWLEPQKVGNLEVIAAESSEVKLHEPLPSDSEDSDALYFGKSDRLGILFQYLGPNAWRTKDPVAHTSVHHHKTSLEGYHLLDGAALIELRNIRTGERKQVLRRELESQVGVYLRGFTVRPYEQHSVVASNGTYSAMLLVTNPPNNTRSDHHQDGLFRDLFPDVIASYTQKTRGLSAAAKEAGSQ